MLLSKEKRKYKKLKKLKIFVYIDQFDLVNIFSFMWINNKKQNKQNKKGKKRRSVGWMQQWSITNIWAGSITSLLVQVSLYSYSFSPPVTKTALSASKIHPPTRWICRSVLMSIHCCNLILWRSTTAITERGRKSEGSTTDTARERPERPWTAARTMEVLRRCPLDIAQRLVHCAITVSTTVLGKSHKDNVRCTAAEEQFEAKEVQLSQPSSTSLIMISSGLTWGSSSTSLLLISRSFDFAWNPVEDSHRDKTEQCAWHIYSRKRLS